MEEDGEEKDDSKRRTRNLSEKKRRDQFNSLISELSSMVTNNSRKMDKSTVLRSTISFLKNNNEITVRSRAHDIQDDWKPMFLSNDEFTYLLLESLEGCIVVFSSSGQIHYVSESVSSLLGHNPAEIVNTNLFELLHNDDRSILCEHLQNPGNMEDSIQSGQENEIHFQCNIKRGDVDLKDEDTYEVVQFDGYSRTNIDPLHNDDMSHHQNRNESRFIFVCTVRLHHSQLVRDVSLVDTNRNEFTSRYSIEWKFLFLDHRATPIIGYLPFEVLGTSGYDYYHYDDLEKVVTCHKALMQKGEMTSCCYRFLTKGQEWIWLQSRYYISYHQWNSKPEFIVCTNRVISYVDVIKNTKQEGTEMELTGEADANLNVIDDTPVNDPIAEVSPPYVCDTGEAFVNTYQPMAQSASLKSMSAASTSSTMPVLRTPTTGAGSWPRAAPESDTTSVSGESRSSLRTSKHDTHKGCEPALLQHNMGAQYLEPTPYIGTISVPGVLPLSLPSVPVVVSSDQAQLQLQRKHEELQQMIMRQQEELRRVKEQLLLARLGMLQPVINMSPVPGPFINPELSQMARLQAPPDYDKTASSSNSDYQQQQPPHSNCNHLPP